MRKRVGKSGEGPGEEESTMPLSTKRAALGSIRISGARNPISFSGLTAGQAYTLTVMADQCAWKWAGIGSSASITAR